MKKFLKRIGILVLVAVLAVTAVNAYVAFSTAGDIVYSHGGEDLSESVLEACGGVDAQCILVFGCSVWAGNRPSPMLKDRLDTAIALYKAGVAPKLLFSGDNGDPHYSEPDCMLNYALEQGVPSEDIFLDYAGFSTYDSVYRAKAVFGAESVIAVTQKYHMYRALKDCGQLGLSAVGVTADQQKYSGRYYREAREVLARCKDLVKCVFKPEPKYLGESIDLTGDGREAR